MAQQTVGSPGWGGRTYRSVKQFLKKQVESAEEKAARLAKEKKTKRKPVLSKTGLLKGEAKRIQERKRYEKELGFD